MVNHFKLSLMLFSSLLLFALSTLSCRKSEPKNVSVNEENLIRQIHNDYVQGWLEMDQNKIMGLLLDNSRIQPNSMKPIDGKNNIENFWFPNDGSVTIINDYETEILSLKILDTLAYTTHNSILDWSYQKDSTGFSMLQKAINTTVYRKDNKGNWKIWRSMWTDIYSKSK